MQEEINHQRTRASYFARLAYDLLHFHERFSHWKLVLFNDDHHRLEFQHFIDEFQRIDQRFQQYRLLFPDESSLQLNLDEYLRTNRFVLGELTTRMNLMSFENFNNNNNSLCLIHQAQQNEIRERQRKSSILVSRIRLTVKPIRVLFW